MSLRLDPLGDQLARDRAASSLSDVSRAPRTKQRTLRKQKEESLRDDDEEVLPADLSRKILKQARSQLSDGDATRHAQRPRGKRANADAPVAERGRALGLLDDDAADDDAEDYALDGGAALEFDERELAVDAADESALRMFAPKKDEPRMRLTLGDIIATKLREHEEAMRAGETLDDHMERRLNPRVYRVYKQVGQFMKSFKSGKLPKAFNVVPSLQNWEELLWVMEPHAWSPHAVYRATRLFAATMPPKQAQRFYALVLLPRIREEVETRNKVTVQVYDALRKSTYKPGAFFKGIVLPMAADRDCSQRDAVVLASVIKRASFPVLHAAAAMMKLAEMPYSVASGIFLRTLLTKKYALPYKTIDALFVHFMSFINSYSKMPTLWHQCLLAYAERYKTDLEPEQKETLKVLLRRHDNPAITPIVRRELYSSECRGGAPPVIDDIDQMPDIDDMTPAQRMVYELHGNMSTD